MLPVGPRESPNTPDRSGRDRTQGEQHDAAAPVIAVPTITLEGDADGASHPEPSGHAGKFSGRYAHRVITGRVGHDLPREAPRAYAEAVLDVARS